MNQDEKTRQDVNVSESPEDFLASLGKTLLEQDNIDTRLAEILSQHLLTTSPASDAVAKAKGAILQLASERANPPQPERDDG
ncbi:hypothetical protein HCU74_11245 [Spongiibacter sp. KMU-166]|uniref:Uncharacterized protein n=1 Tax=Spongiibacter thalassae TaxID=2721624 RepID=A0ABX1GIG7_9GAMM|nr:hypothetical protein [Spongiibacter thalassae]NKI17979.1 hypothetical protein [Spongiibacter thalassae]